MRLFDFVKNPSLNTQKKLTYIAVGAWNTLFGYLAFLFLYYLTHDFLHYMLILVLSQMVGLTNAYICYKFLVFKTKGNYLKEYLRFYVIYGTTFIVNLILIGFFVEFIGLNPVISQALISVLVVAMAYFGHSRFSFKSN